MIANIVNVLSQNFFQNALIIGVLLGLLLPLIGIVVLFKKMNFIADALGHINMSSIALVFLINSYISITIFSQYIIIFIWNILGAILIEYLRTKYKSHKDISIMIVYSIAISLTMIFLNLSQGFQSSFFNVLFGNINTVSSNEVIIGITITMGIITFLIFNYKNILIISLEEENAKLYGINSSIFRYILIILISIVITIAIKILGVLLVSSLIIIPNLAAIRISKSLKETIIYGIIITEFSFVFGMILGYILNISSSATISLIAIIIYLCSFLKKNNKK